MRSEALRDHLLALTEDLEHAPLDGVDVVGAEVAALGREELGAGAARGGAAGGTPSKTRANCAEKELAVYCMRVLPAV